LVEDEESVRGLAAKVLGELGYNVLEAKNGKEAIKMSAQNKGTIHLLLTDLVMPGMSGNEVVKHLAAERPEMKAIYMSGYTDDIISLHGILNQETNFLQKPFSPRALAQMIREMLDSR
jgi:CheY-like chemotaxis protein